MAACAIAAGFLGGTVAFTQQASAELLEPDIVDPALNTTCTITFPAATRTVTFGVGLLAGVAVVHGSAVVTGCTPAGVGPGTLTLSIVNANGTASTCLVLGQNQFPVVNGNGSGEINGECPASLANPTLYRIQACVVWPGKVPSPFCALSGLV